MDALYDLFRELNAKHFGNSLPECPLRLSKRRRSVGLITYTPSVSIEISRYFFENNPLHSRGQNDSVEETLLHEMVHYDLWNRLKHRGHGRLFQQAALEVGLKHHRFSYGEVAPRKVVYFCPLCKREWYRYRRWSSKRYCRLCSKKSGRPIPLQERTK